VYSFCPKWSTQYLVPGLIDCPADDPAADSTIDAATEQIIVDRLATDFGS
jgi:hypothetical protein